MLQDTNLDEETQALLRSQSEEFDAKFKMLNTTTLNQCSDIQTYVAKHLALHAELSVLSGEELSKNVKKSCLRSGLPGSLRDAVTFFDLDRLEPSTLREKRLVNVLARKISAISPASRAQLYDDLSETSSPSVSAQTETKRRADDENITDILGTSSKRVKTDRLLELDEYDDELIEGHSSYKSTRSRQPLGAQPSESSRPETDSNEPKKKRPSRNRKSGNQTEPSSNITNLDLYFLGPSASAYEVFSYLHTFAAAAHRYAPKFMNVLTLPNPQKMLKILESTVQCYSRSRTNAYLGSGRGASTGEKGQSLEVVNIDHQLMAEPTNITQAATLADSIAAIADIKRQSQSLVVYQRMMESWASEIIHNAAGCRMGDDLTRAEKIAVKHAAWELMPVLRPNSMQSIEDQAVLRTQRCWALLAEFRAQGLAFIVAYRPNTTDSILLSADSSRLRVHDIGAWIPTIQQVERHIVDWFDAIEGGRGRSELRPLIESIYCPSHWASMAEFFEFDESYPNPNPYSSRLPPFVPHLVMTYGFYGWLSKRKIWSVMLTPDQQHSIAIANIPEASFLGIVPGVLRRSMMRAKGGIGGLAGTWLDTRHGEGSLSRIRFGSKNEVNTVFGWHVGGSHIPGVKSPWLLAFSCRPILIFEELVAWDGISHTVQEDAA